MLHNQPTNRKQPSILGAGLVCLDIIKHADSFRYLNGGSCGNVVSALSFLGWHGSVITGSYSDPASDILHNNLSKIKVSQLKVSSSNSKTPRIIENLTIDEGRYIGHDYLLECPACGQKLPPLKPLTKNAVAPLLNDVCQYDVLYCDRSSEGIQTLKAIFQKSGQWIVYEPNSARNINSFYKNSCESHIVKFSGDRIPQSVADKLRQLAHDGLTTLIVRTVGKDGLFYSYRKRDKKMSDWFHLDSQPISHYVDASGAGDWCTTGLLFGLVGKFRKSKLWLSKEDVIAALQYGQALAAISCAFIGAQGLFYSDVSEESARQLFKDRTKMPKIRPTSISLSKNLCHVCLLSLSRP